MDTRNEPRTTRTSSTRPTKKRINARSTDLQKNVCPKRRKNRTQTRNHIPPTKTPGRRRMDQKPNLPTPRGKRTRKTRLLPNKLRRQTIPRNASTLHRINIQPTILHGRRIRIIKTPAINDERTRRKLITIIWRINKCSKK